MHHSASTTYVQTLGKGGCFREEMPANCNPDHGVGNNPNYNAFSMDASRVVPTSSENRPINTAVKYFIRAIG